MSGTDARDLMPILALGVSYRSAPVDLLERLSFANEDAPKAYKMLLDAPAVSEAVVLSTCNRVEVYAAVASYHAGFQDLKRFLSESREVPPEELGEPLYSHYESHAAEHLFSVAAGIDSVVLGEPQILTQVRQAFRVAQAEGAVGPLLAALFRAAVRAGRRARSETAIGSSAAGFVEAGVDLAARVLGDVRGRPAVVVGAGEMARLAVAHLRERGAAPVRIVNRSRDRARRLAERFGAEDLPLEDLPAALAGGDLGVSSTGATGAVIGPDGVREAMRLREGGAARPLFLLDLAVPRDVDPAVRGVPGVHVADLDDLKRVIVEASGEAEHRDVSRVRAIVGEEVRRFEAWRRAARLGPLIEALREKGARAGRQELARLAPRLAGLDERQREAVEALVERVVNKLLHDPIVRLKDGTPTGDGHARALAELFGLSFPGEDRRSR